MLRILIADDEPKVCKLITCLIDWDALGLEIAGTVHHGQAALDFLAAEPVDIIITDIRMPGVNGLELIERAKELKPGLNFIIISGYKHFDYAQKAIKFGVEDYILKPIKEKELLLCLKRIIEKQSALQKNQQETAVLKDQLQSDIEKSRRAFFHELIRSRSFEPLKETAEQLNEHYHYQFGAPLYLVMIIRPIFYEKLEDEELVAFFTSKIEQLIYGSFSRFQELMIIRRDQTVYCLFNGTAADIAFLKGELKELRSSIQKLQDVFRRMKLYIFLSQPHPDAALLPLCIEEARQASYDRFLTFSSIIEYTPLPASAGPELTGREFRSRYLAAIETLNSDTITELAEELTVTLLNTAKSGKYIRDIFWELLDMFEFGIKSYHPGINYRDVTERLKRAFTNHINLNELMADFLTAIRKCFQDYKAEKSQELTKPIRSAKEYIRDHYAEPISLELIGSRVGLNPAYFSSLFKKETGSSFIDYLNEVRIENAKRILLEDDGALTEICERVGFNDIKYFKRRFKKSTGLSPSEYRKLYS